MTEHQYLKLSHILCREVLRVQSMTPLTDAQQFYIGYMQSFINDLDAKNFEGAYVHFLIARMKCCNNLKKDAQC